MTEEKNFDLPKPSYMDNCEFDTIHYYFNQIAYPNSYKNIIEILLQRRISNYSDSEYEKLVNNSRAIVSISKFNGYDYLGDRVYAYIDGKIEIICVRDFETPELDKLLDGPFNTFQELKLAFNEFLEKLELKYLEDFIRDCEQNNMPEILIEFKETKGNNKIEVESGIFLFSSNDLYNFFAYRLDKDLTCSHLNKYKYEIAETLNISLDRIYDYIDTNTIYYIEELTHGIYGNPERVGIRYFAKVSDMWMIIYNNNFGGTEYCECVLGPFDSEKTLCLELEAFMNLGGSIRYAYEDAYDDFRYKPHYDGDNYVGAYARDVEGLSDDFIDNALGGDPDAYWNID